MTGSGLAETQHDAFLPLVLAAEHTTRSSWARRSPGVPAQPDDAGVYRLGPSEDERRSVHHGPGHPDQAAHERRFGIAWDRPTARLREYVLALRHIWNAWQTDGRLNFRGEMYKLTLMAPFFNPGPIAHPHIPIYIAGVNEHLCRLAGELCEGFHVHPFHTPKYIAEFVLPEIEKGLQKGGRTRKDITLASSIFVVAGDTPAERAQSRESVRQQISFYASTPTYRPVSRCMAGPPPPRSFQDWRRAASGARCPKWSATK